MKLYDGGRAPNPRRVRIFIAEKQVKDIEIIPIDMENMGHRSAEITQKNPLQRLPILELNDGTIITESVAICRYIEEQHSKPPQLFGKGAVEKAIVEMWQRRIEWHLFLPIANVFRHSHPAMKTWEVPQVAEFAKANIPKVKNCLVWLDAELASRPFIAGKNFTIADITALVAIDFMKPAKLLLPEGLHNVAKWYTNISNRESSKA